MNHQREYAEALRRDMATPKIDSLGRLDLRPQDERGNALSVPLEKDERAVALLPAPPVY